MKTIYNIAAALMILAMAAMSCKKVSPVGPNLVELYGKLIIKDSLSHNKPNGVDFSKDSVQFNGKWSIITPWKLTITGRTSGAVKTLTGKSKTLDTLMGIWNGTADCIFFINNEICDVKLSFDEHPDTMKSTIKILGLHDYKKDGSVILADFESNMAYNGGKSNRISTGIIPQGKSFYYIQGTEPGSYSTVINGKDTTIGAKYYLGGFSSFTSSTGNYYKFGTSNASNVYVNFFAKGYNFIDTYLTFSFKVDTESFTQRIKIPLNGWAKMSFTLNEPLNDNTKSKTLIDISKINEIDVSLFSAGNKRDTIACGIDFIIITTGKPL